jgi:anti-sigma factor RsiW
MKERNMSCPLQSENTLDVLLDYSAGKLDRSRLARLEQHLLTCAECSAFLTGQTELWQTLNAWEPEAVSMDFNRRLWQRIDAEAAQPWYRKLADSLRTGAWKPALPLAAAVLLVTTAFVMDHQRSVPALQGVETVSGVSAGNSNGAPLDADQVEKTLNDMQLLGQLDVSSAEPNTSKTM